MWVNIVFTSFVATEASPFIRSETPYTRQQTATFQPIIIPRYFSATFITLLTAITAQLLFTTQVLVSNYIYIFKC